MGNDQHDVANEPASDGAGDGTVDDLDRATRRELEDEAAGAGHPVDLSADDEDD